MRTDLNKLYINNTGRFEWLDSLRGLAMIIVVYRHVYGFTFNASAYERSSVVGALFPVFAMPIFFFISGFLSYKKSDYWNFGNCKKKLNNRFVQLVVPSIVFYLLLNGFVRPMPFPGGYWFTIVLFEIFFIFYAIEFLLRPFGSKIHDVILIGLGLILFMFKNRIPSGILFDYTASKNLCEYFIYFCIGVCVGKYKSFVFTIIDKKQITLWLMIALLFGFYMKNWAELKSMASVITLTNQLLRFLLIFISLSYFQLYGSFFSSQNRFAKILRYIGRHTLAIYMLHYFFLWPTVPFVGKLIAGCSNFPLELILVGSWSLLVLVLSFILISFIRISPLASRFLLADNSVCK